MFSKDPIAVALALCGAALVMNAAPMARPVKTKVIKSVFTIPSNSREGRDPFFPNSLRPYEIAAAAQPQKAGDLSSLVIKGFSGELTNRLVIINNHTFAEGDEGDVITSTTQIHLRCIKIKTHSVIIEVGGQRHELFYSNSP